MVAYIGDQRAPFDVTWNNGNDRNVSSLVYTFNFVQSILNDASDHLLVLINHVGMREIWPCKAVPMKLTAFERLHMTSDHRPLCILVLV